MIKELASIALSCSLTVNKVTACHLTSIMLLHPNNDIKMILFLDLFRFAHTIYVLSVLFSFSCCQTTSVIRQSCYRTSGQRRMAALETTAPAAATTFSLCSRKEGLTMESFALCRCLSGVTGWRRLRFVCLCRRWNSWWALTEPRQARNSRGSRTPRGRVTITAFQFDAAVPQSLLQTSIWMRALIIRVWQCKRECIGPGWNWCGLSPTGEKVVPAATVTVCRHGIITVRSYYSTCKCIWFDWQADWRLKARSSRRRDIWPTRRTVHLIGSVSLDC